jgi:Mrp family chromosome partitioning ATPase
MAGLLDRLITSYDTVVLDSPPLLPVTDAAVLSKLAGGALVVVGADRIHRPQLQETLGALETAGAHALGIVLNKIDRREAGSYSYDSGYAPTAIVDVRGRSAWDQTVEMDLKQRSQRVPVRAR